MATLSDKEKRLLELLDRGHTMAEIAKEFGVVRQTVWRWLHKIEEKLGRRVRVPNAKRLRKRRLTLRQRTAVQMFEKYGSVVEAARRMGINKATMSVLLKRAEENGAEIVGRGKRRGPHLR